MSASNPMGVSSRQPPDVSKTTIPVAGLLVDVYGLDELPTGATAVSCLWLHHGRLRNKDDMAEFAALALSAWHAAAKGTGTSTSAGTASASTVPFLDIPAAETARRREKAVGLLEGKGIDPSTLSEDQMSIFLNQAPEIQKSSLDMFVKYGAKRLRFVHPNEDPGVPTNTTGANKTSSRGLIAVAFDERNHGTRMVNMTSNGSWRDGNKTHAQDMFGVVTGSVVDMSHLMDALEGYLFGNGGSSPGNLQALGSRKQAALIDQHLALGVSQGGHTVWQAMFAEPRLSAGVVVIGCPDYMAVMTDRARLSRLPTYSAADNGASFLGSRDFPHALVEACKKYDPRGILFGTREVSMPTSDVDKERLKSILGARLAGKKFQVLSGGVDKLVPYALAKPFLDFFKSATETWASEANISVEDIVYPGVGHKFDDAMMKDAVRFIVNRVSEAETRLASTAAKI